MLPKERSWKKDAVDLGNVAAISRKVKKNDNPLSFLANPSSIFKSGAEIVRGLLRSKMGLPRKIIK